MNKKVAAGFSLRKIKRNLKIAAADMVICVFAAFFIAHFSFLHADWANHIVISELAFRGAGGASDEFVELYNPTDAEVDISAWKIYKKGIEGEWIVLKTIDAATAIPAYSFYLICPQGAPLEGEADATYSTAFGRNLPDDGGNIRVTLPTGEGSTVIDTVAYTGSSGAGQDGEGTAVPKHEDGSSVERKATASSTPSKLAAGGTQENAGNGWDTDENSEDFIIQITRNPQNSGSAAEYPPPDKITDFAVVGTPPFIEGTLTCTWTASVDPNLDHYNMYRATYTIDDEVCKLYKDDISKVDSPPYTDVAMTQHVTYYYQITVMGTSESEKSDIISGYSVDQTPPAKITGLTALNTGMGGEVRLDWVPSSAADIYLYTIGYDDESIGAGWGIASTYTISGLGKSSTTVVESLTNGTKYYFKISALDFNGNESAELSNSAFATPTDIYPPSPVEKSYFTVTNEGSGTAVILDWTLYSPPSDLDYYRVYYSTYELSPPYDVHTSTCFAAVQDDTKTRSVTGLTPDVEHYFMITGVDTEGNEKNELPSDLYWRNATPSDEPPSEITTLAASNEGSGGKINLSWTASSESDVTSYRLYEADFSSLTASDFNKKQDVSVPAISLTVTGLTDLTTYYFRISAIDAAAQKGVISSTASAVPTDTAPPGKPTPITITRLLPPTTGGVLMLIWTNPGDLDFAAVKIYCSTDNSSSVILLNLEATLQKTTDYYCHSPLTNGVTYYYIFHSVDETGNESTGTDICSGRPLP